MLSWQQGQARTFTLVHILAFACFCCLPVLAIVAVASAKAVKQKVDGQLDFPPHILLGRSVRLMCASRVQDNAQHTTAMTTSN